MPAARVDRLVLRRLSAGVSMIRIVLCVLLCCVAGCDEAETKPTAPTVRRLNQSPEITYVILVIEGKRWLATPGSHGEWSLAGPIE